DLPAVFRAFDVACPDQTIEKRPRTTVPQQALFAMNSRFVLTQAKALADRSLPGNDLNPKERVNALYRLALGRLAANEELASAVAFVKEVQVAGAEKSDVKLGAWEQLTQAL